MIDYWTRQGTHQNETRSPLLNLGKLLEDTGRLVEAEQILIKALQTSKQIYGLEHWETLNVMYSLGHGLNDMARFREAKIVLEQQVLLGKERLGEFHYTTLHGVSALSKALRGLELYGECEKYLTYYASCWGAMSDDDAKKFVKKLAEFYYQREKFDQVEIWCRLLLQQNERSLGKLHETTLKSASELADVLYQQDKTIE